MGKAGDHLQVQREIAKVIHHAGVNSAGVLKRGPAKYQTEDNREAYIEEDCGDGGAIARTQCRTHPPSRDTQAHRYPRAITGI